MKTLLIVVLLITGAPSPAQEWTTDTAAVTFNIRNAGIAVNGTFDSLEIRLEHSEKDWKAARLFGRVYAASIVTGMGLRDKHLRKEDYFQVQTHPWIYMESTDLKRAEKGELEGVFRLTLKEHTREIPLVFACSETKDKISLETSFELDRQEFGVGGKSLFLSDRVRVFVSAEFSSTR